MLDTVLGNADIENEQGPGFVTPVGQREEIVNKQINDQDNCYSETCFEKNKQE